jgi:hypothetical protein
MFLRSLVQSIRKRLKLGKKLGLDTPRTRNIINKLHTNERAIQLLKTKKRKSTPGIGYNNRLSMSVVTPLKHSQHLSLEDRQKPLLQLVMNNSTLHDLLTKWTEHEMSVENVQIYDLIQSYKRAKYNPERRKHLADYIKESFLQPNANFSLNVREETVERCLMDIEMGLYDDLLFLGIEVEVEHTLNDSLGRFCMGSEYQSFMDSEELNMKSLLHVAMAEKRKSFSPVVCK